MGRYSTGAWTVNESQRLDLSWLLARGYIKKGCSVFGTMHWKNNHGKHTGSVSFESYYKVSGQKDCMILRYTHTTKEGEKTEHEQQINLIEKPSNLGKGRVLFFRCPVLGAACRILYMAYGSGIFKSRNAYNYRLYYRCQQNSKMNRYNDCFWELESKLENLASRARYGARKYSGQFTRQAIRYKTMVEKKHLMDHLRWNGSCLPHSLKKAFGYI